MDIQQAVILISHVCRTSGLQDISPLKTKRQSRSRFREFQVLTGRLKTTGCLPILVACLIRTEDLQKVQRSVLHVVRFLCNMRANVDRLVADQSTENLRALGALNTTQLHASPSCAGCTNICSSSAIPPLSSLADCDTRLIAI